MRKPYLSVIIPCYNEKENLKRGVLLKVFDYLRKQTFAWEVIVSDDGSTDNSKKLVKKQIKRFKNFRLLENSHGGKPSALLHGVKVAKGKYVLLSDMDLSTPISELKKLLPFTKKDYPVVIGSRGISRKNFPFYRKLGAMAFATIRRTLLMPEIVDTQCGFKLFDAEVLKKSFPRLEFFKTEKRTSGWMVTSYDVELLHILKKMGCRIKEVVVDWNDQDVSKGKGSATKKYLKESREMLLQIIRVKINEFRNLYDDEKDK